MHIFFLLALIQMGWQPGLIERHTYKLGETGIPGTATYSLRGVLREGKKVLEVSVETHRVMTLGGQQGKLESEMRVFMEPSTFDFIESRLTTTLNGTEASYLHSLRKGETIEVFQQLRGSPPDRRSVGAVGITIDESALTFFLERVDFATHKTIEWQRYNPAQTRLQTNKATLENGRVKLESDIAPAYYELSHGKPPVVERIEAGGVEQMRLADPPAEAAGAAKKP